MERHHPNYLAVWVWLALLMLASVLSSYLPTSAMIIISIILVLSLIKALLVALYYMHLRFERRLLLIVIVAPLVLAGILIIGNLPDSAQARRVAPTPPPAQPEATHESSTPHPTPDL